MRPKVWILASVICLFIASAAGQDKPDMKGCKDHPLFTRMPGYWIRYCTEKQFDSYDFTVAGGKRESVEGRFWRYNYNPQPTLSTKPSPLQIQRNFENAIKELGGAVLYTTKGRSTLRVTKDGKDVWVQLDADFTGGYAIFMIEKETMAQDVVANAAAFSKGLQATGHVTVEGIYFDTAKSVLKPESEQAISEIAKLLTSDPALKLFVVGHTDTVGSLDANMRLSQDRAAAVVQALVGKHGVTPARLKSFGNGPYAPVASNDTEEGRAKNRRVELVKQ